MTTAIYRTPEGGAEILAFYEQLLTQWPVPHTRLIVPTRHGDTFVIASGPESAPPLVLIHGTASNSITWMGDVVHYAKYFRVYAADIPGEPGKSDPQRFSWEGTAFVEWMDDLLNGLAIDRATFGGMSLGGWAVLNYAIHHPARVERLILIVPGGICQPRLAFIARVLIYSLLGQWGQDRLKEYIFHGAPLPPDAEHFMTLVNRHFRYRTGSLPLFSDEQLRSLTMPVIFLAGENDVLLNTPKTAERLTRLVPNITVECYADVGHATIDTAARVLELISSAAILH